MKKELSENSKFQISIKTLIAIIVGIVSIVSTYFGLESSFLTTKSISLIF